MASVKICLILVIGTLFFGFFSNVDCMDYDYEQESTRPGSRITRDAVKDDNDGYGSASANYNFQYAVNEGGSGAGNDFGHEEERNGHTTRGQYHVLLPDGRMQIVKYVADANGYRAEVTYEGGGGYSSPPSSPPATTDTSSYGSPPQPPQPAAVQTVPATSASSYGPAVAASSPRPRQSSPSTFGRRISGSFVKSRANILGQNHNYNYSF